jgi:cation/acetate symporter
MRSTSRTQIAQYAVLLAVSLTALAILFWLPQSSARGQGASIAEALAALKLASFAADDPVNRFALIFCLAAGTASLPHLLMRSFTTPTAYGARTSFLWSLPFVGVLCLAAPVCAAMFGSASAPESDAASAMLGDLAVTGAIAALLAAGSGLLIAIANSLSYDIYYKTLRPIAPTERRLLMARSSVVLVAGLAALAAFAGPHAIPAMAGAAFSLAASAFLPALLLGVWWKRTSGEGALAGMLTGLVVCLYYLIAPHYVPFAFYETSSFLSNATQDQASAYATLRQIYYGADPAVRDAVMMLWEIKVQEVANWFGVKTAFAAVFAVPLGTLAAVGVSLFTAAPSRDVQGFVEELHRSAHRASRGHSASTFSVSQTLISD